MQPVPQPCPHCKKLCRVWQFSGFMRPCGYHMPVSQQYIDAGLNDLEAWLKSLQ